MPWSAENRWKPYRMPRWPDNLIDSVFYLYPTEEDAKAGSRIGACGFLVSIPWDHPQAAPNRRHIYAVSNYHAAVGACASVIRLNTKDGYSDTILTEPCEWFWRDGHDVAVNRLDEAKHFGPRTIWQYAQTPLLESVLTDHLQREFQFGPGDEVVSVGRFVDIHGTQQNTPLIRSGIIASKGPVSVRTDEDVPWEKETCWIVEMRSGTGFSGSPVYTYIPPWQPTYVEAPGRKYGNFFYGPWLLGIHTSQVPHGKDSQSAGAGMVAVVPCSALDELLMTDDKVREDRAAYEKRLIDAPVAISEAAPNSDGNPAHREDFSRLLNEAAKKREPKD